MERYLFEKKPHISNNKSIKKRINKGYEDTIKLGRVCDLEFDPCSGCICKIMVPGCNKLLGFLNCEPNIVIPFRDIKQIGPDIILVDIHC